MQPAARIQAAIEALGDVLTGDRSASVVLADWGRSHRFAGSGDRAAIADFVFDALRRKSSAGHLMADDSPRGLVLGILRLSGQTPEAIAVLTDGSQHGPAALSPAEIRALSAPEPAGAPAHVAGDFPLWLQPSLERAFGHAMVAEASALARRATLDLRANTLRATRTQVLDALGRLGPTATPWSPLGIRVPASHPGGRLPRVEAEGSYAQGWFEVQDEGSQIAALLASAKPDMQVADICAGAGGKTLALAAAMSNRGRIFAYDVDAARLHPLRDRMQRAGATNVELLPAGAPASLAPLADRMDLVLVDAPCTGSGTWRRAPDTKWRLTPEDLAQRCVQQATVLALAAPLVRPGGRLVYVTCSVLPEENADQVAAFVRAYPQFSVRPFAQAWAWSIGNTAPISADQQPDTLQLTPRTHGTDGFFVAVMERRA